ncbi:MAG: acetate/propionate family kinase [Ramlibacter sp.]
MERTVLNPAGPCVLSLNGGSSSIKFALYHVDKTLHRSLGGMIDRIGQGYARLSFERLPERRTGSIDVPAKDHGSAVASLIEWLASPDGLCEAGGKGGIGAIDAIGHRVVHGMNHMEPETITDALLDELRRIQPYDPDHLPGEIALIEAFRRKLPQVPQVACFDTAFHRGMPRVAKLLPIPRRYDAKGLQRYGFHGLSYAYLMEELARVGGTSAAQGRVVLAHLGSGASMAAVQDGRGIDTSMGFTPSAGLPMGTRSGDLDPGLAAYLALTENMGGPQFQHMVNHASGLLGMSETSADMRDLLAVEATDVRAAEAVAVFCYQAKKCIGAYAAALGGLDTLVFAGGVGEHAAPVRERICQGMGFLGIEIDATRNAEHAAVISTASSRVTVRVTPTDEELMIARSVSRVLGLSPTQATSAALAT